MIKNPRLTIFLMALVLHLISACGPPSEKKLLLGLVDQAGRAGEKKDVQKLLGLLSEDYVDFEGRDKTQTGALLQEYFRRYRGIVVHVLGARIGETGPEGEMALEVEVVLSSGKGEMLRKLIRVSGEYFRFTMGVVRSGELRRIRRAGWEPVAVGDLLPQSLTILKKLFPDL